MRLLRNLSIGRKLALSSGVAILLLAVLASGVLVSLARQSDLTGRLSIAQGGQSRAMLALSHAEAMRASSRDMQFAPAKSAMRGAADHATSEAKRAGEELAAIDVDALQGAAPAAVAAARAALEASSETLRRKEVLRAAQFAARDGPLQSALASYGKALAKAREDVLAEPLTRVQFDLIGAKLALFDGGVAQFRAIAVASVIAGGKSSGYLTAIETMTETLQRGLATVALSDTYRASLALLADTAAKVRQAALSVQESGTTLDEFTRKEADVAGQAFDRRLAELATFFDGMARKADAESAASERLARRVVLALTASILLILLVSSVVTARAIAQPMRAMTAMVQRMAKGDTANQIGFTRRTDEVGRMAAALEVLRAELQRAFLLAQMVDQLPVGVMTCEATGTFRILYANRHARGLIGEVAESVSASPEELVGSDIDVLNDAAPAIRRLLADPSKLPRHERIPLGAAVFDVGASALRSADGSYAGPMMAWSSATRQVQLSITFEGSVAGIARAIGESAAGMARTAGAMSARAAASGEQLVAVADVSRSSTAHVRTVASSAEELALSVAKIAAQVAESAGIAGGAVAEAAAADRVMAGLADVAGRISDVVRLIGDIAGRTNLLALNATIEAARAGDAGRGFAVVASEVKALAGQTERATEDIAAQITAMQGAAGATLGALRSIGGTIQRMSDIATAIAGAVEEQGRATRAIASGVQEAAAGAGQVDRILADVSDAVAATGTQASEMVSETQLLSRQAERLDAEVGGFLIAMRDAA